MKTDIVDVATELCSSFCVRYGPNHRDRTGVIRAIRATRNLCGASAKEAWEAVQVALSLIQQKGGAPVPDEA